MTLKLFRVVDTSDNHNEGLIIQLDPANLPTDFTHRDFYYDNLIWEVFDGGLRVHNDNYVVVLKEVV